MSGSVSSESRADPNLTPILDMVFQLITFFMLVINFKSQTMDLTLKLPVVGSARPVEGAGQDLVILNINNQGQLKVYGNTVKDIAGHIGQEAAASLMAAQKVKPDLKAGDELPSTVIIRADKTTPFGLLNKVIVCCQDNGFRKFSLKAMNKAEQ